MEIVLLRFKDYKCRNWLYLLKLVRFSILCENFGDMTGICPVIPDRVKFESFVVAVTRLQAYG